MKCARCGMHTPRLTIGQRYCPQCEREVEVRLRPRELKGPAWLSRLQPRDMTGSAA